jgi:hypothetical protein
MERLAVMVFLDLAELAGFEIMVQRKLEAAGAVELLGPLETAQMAAREKLKETA